MWPSWRTYEPLIRRLAGLGEAPGASALPPARVEHSSCDVLVAGAGPAGLAAALAAARCGARVIVLEREPVVGGELEYETATVDARPALEWVAAARQELEAHGASLLTATTLVGGTDGLYQAHTVSPGCRETVRKIRPRAFVLAMGAVERPIVFVDNDRPGVMLLGAAERYSALPRRARGTHGGLVRESRSRVRRGAAPAAMRACGFGRSSTAAHRVHGSPVAKAQRARLLRRRASSVWRATSCVAAAGRREVRGASIAPVPGGRSRRRRLRVHPHERRMVPGDASRCAGRRRAPVRRGAGGISRGGTTRWALRGRRGPRHVRAAGRVARRRRDGRGRRALRRISSRVHSRAARSSETALRSSNRAGERHAAPATGKAAVRRPAERRHGGGPARRAGRRLHRHRARQALHDPRSRHGPGPHQRHARRGDRCGTERAAARRIRLEPSATAVSPGDAAVAGGVARRRGTARHAPDADARLARRPRRRARPDGALDAASILPCQRRGRVHGGGGRGAPRARERRHPRRLDARQDRDCRPGRGRLSRFAVSLARQHDQAGSRQVHGQPARGRHRARRRHGAAGRAGALRRDHEFGPRRTHAVALRTLPRRRLGPEASDGFGRNRRLGRDRGRGSSQSRRAADGARRRVATDRGHS